MDYKTTVFIIVKPPSKIISAHRVSNRTEHDDLLAKTKQNSNCLYYASAVTKNGRQYAKQPWILDPDSVVNPPDVQKKEPATTSPEPKSTENTTYVSEQLRQAQGEFFCKTCGKKCSSKSGLTLHYKASKACNDEQGVKEQAAPETNVLKQESNGLSCPFCDKKVSSKSGLTLHLKSKHGA